MDARGENIFPSTPSRAKMGRKTTIMIKIEKRIGRFTSRAAFRIMEVLSSFMSPLFLRRRKMFSTITIAPSTSMPIPIAMPPRDMRLAEIPNNRIPIMAIRAQRGNERATIKAHLRFPKKTTRVSTTNKAPNANAFFTVHVA